MNAAPLLIELSTEELPPKALQQLGNALATALVRELGRHHLVDTNASVEVFASPRHIGACIDNVSAQASARQVRIKGPSIKVGLDESGQPSVALTKWAEKQGVNIAELERDSSGKQETFVAHKTVVGAVLANVIDDVIDAAIAAMPIPKLMQYQLADGQTTISFVRPAHHLIVLHGNQVVPAQALGLSADRITFGHRFTGATVSEDLPDQPIQVTVETADTYASAMHNANVVVRFADRRQQIHDQLIARAEALNLSLGEAGPVEQLLDEVTALVEWPAIYVGQFEEEFLQVPPECLILTMRTNQKYFPLFHQDGTLSNRFLICSNLRIDDPALIIDGNERVVRPRLADAEFFFDQDRKTTLASRCERLNSVIYHAKLGTQAERSQRVADIAVHLANMLGLSDEQAKDCERAARLAKTDLLTDMVGEFPELQGIMGTYYARHDGEKDALAIALTEQYQPRFAGDKLPATVVGTVLAMADKLETLAGMFAIGQRPSGDKDPFALRRHALGVLRMLIEKPLPLSLHDLLAMASACFDADEKHRAALTDFVYDRLTGYLRDAGHGPAHIAAVVAGHPARLDDILQRLAAVAEFSKMPEAQALAAANKRIGNILRKADAELNRTPDPALFEQDAEQALATTIDQLDEQVARAVNQANYTEALTLMALAREPVDRFFDDVMVMADNQQVRHNRLLMLSNLHQLMNRVADISRLANN